MGSRHSKIEGSYLPETPLVQRGIDCVAELSQASSSVTNADVFSGANDKLVLYKRPEQQKQPEVFIQQQSAENPFSVFGKRLLKRMSYNMQDPRSPNLNRTPLMLEESERTLNLDDTFADLFVDTRVPKNMVLKKATENEVVKSEVMQMDELIVETVAVCEEKQSNCNDSMEFNSVVSVVEEETMPCAVKLVQTPSPKQHPFDPRSPTVGLERTPIVFTDDDEVNEEAMLENILATLSLDISSSNSFSSLILMPSSTNKTCGVDKSLDNNIDNKRLPSNKPLERVRQNGRRQLQRGQNKSKNMIRNRQRIYEEPENATLFPTESSTTKKYVSKDDKNYECKRTPLSCVKNRSHLLLLYKNSDGKALKGRRLALSSSDNSPNILQNTKIAKVDAQQECRDLEI